MHPRRGEGRGEYSEERGRGYRGYGNPQNPYNQGAFDGRGGGRRGRQDARYGEDPEYGMGRGGRGQGRGRGPATFQAYEQEGIGAQGGRPRPGGPFYEGRGSYFQPMQYQQGDRGRRGRGRGGQDFRSAESFEAPMQPVPTPERLAMQFEKSFDIGGVFPEEQYKQGSSSGEIPSDVAESLLPAAAPSDPAGTSEDLKRAAQVSSKAIVALSRPGFGVNGTKVLIKVNHFKVDLSIDTVYHYDVDIQPQITSKAIARRLISSLVSSYRSVELANRLPVYDGSKNMFSAGRFAFDSKLFTVPLLDERGQIEQRSGKKERIFKVMIKQVASLARESLDLFLEGKQTNMPQDFLQALDIALREGPSNFYVPVGGSFFDPRKGVQKLDGGLVGSTGFYQSLRPTLQGLALNVDLSTTAFYEETDVIDFLGKILPRFNPRVRLGGSDKVQARKSLMHLKVGVKHRETSRKYRISGLSDLPTNACMFEMDGRSISLVDYFLEVYKHKMMYPELPSLLVNPNKGTYLPMEVCRISSGQKYRGKLNETQTTNILKMAAKKPAEREGLVLNIMKQENAPARDQFAREFGLEVSRKFTELHARVLSPPKLKYGGGQNPVVTPSNGSWNLLNSRFVEGAHIQNWALIDLSNTENYIVERFANELTRRCSDLGLFMNGVPVLPFRRARLDNNIETVLKRLNDDAQRAIGNQQPARLQLIFCIMYGRSPLYAEIKRVSETEIGVVTQCCLSKHINNAKNLSQYLANLAMKINVKAGGKNVVFFDELPKQLPNMFSVPTIIFGADVTHPVASDDASPSIAAVVANVDWPTATKYVSRVRAQKHREEIIVDLAAMVRELLMEFYQSTNSIKPGKIVFFRDGVSEGQFYSVLHHELNALLSACQSLEPTYRPKVTWVVVQKRHHTRFIPADRNMFKDNVLPGTVVDRVITHPREFDFYLVSHAGLQGTSRPTHYHILWDENQFQVDELQALVNNLCYTYARCTKAVSCVPPAYYAHLVAYRARLYVDSSGSGSDTSSGRDGKFGTSLTSASGSRSVVPPVQALPPLHKAVQSVMYYC